jgi:cytochrome bd-type quinol oxidase subunit 2
MNAAHEVHASLLDLLHPYALLGGLTTLSLFAAHGANFLTLRTRDELQGRAVRLAHLLTPIAALITAAFVVWTVADQSFAASVTVCAIRLGAPDATESSILQALHLAHAQGLVESLPAGIDTPDRRDRLPPVRRPGPGDRARPRAAAGRAGADPRRADRAP